MRLLHWSCQGLGNTLTVPHINDIRRIYNPDIMLLVETKNIDSYVNSVIKDQGYNHSFVVMAKDSSGGLVMRWNDGVKIHFWGTPSLNKTDMYVEHGSNIFCLTYIYGYREIKSRKVLWEHLGSEKVIKCLGSAGAKSQNHKIKAGWMVRNQELGKLQSGSSGKTRLANSNQSIQFFSLSLQS